MNVYTVRQATPLDAAAIADMVQQLLEEIMTITGSMHFHVDLPAMVLRSEKFVTDGTYTVFIAMDRDGHTPAGLITLTETHSLYAGGAFGIIPELYVQPAFRCSGVGFLLMEAAKAFGCNRGWQRLEVTTPSLPAFERTFDFYRRYGFEVAGGKKMKVLL